MSDLLNGLIEFEDIWAVYDVVSRQLKAEESDHDEGELELLLAVVQDETDDYLRRRRIRLPFSNSDDPELDPWEE